MAISEYTKPTSGSTLLDDFLGLFKNPTMLWVKICPCMQPRRKEEAKNVENDGTGSSYSTSFGERSLSVATPRSIGEVNVSEFWEASGPLKLSFSDISKITNNFSNSNVIGHGGFGVVYKGQLKDGRVIAVKRAKKERGELCVDKEFQNEVSMLSLIEHNNLVKLMGFFENEHERILLIEFVPNGNLRAHLDGVYRVTLDLAVRLDIAIDIAHALTYLHLYAEQPIIHGDVKSSNVLLTNTFRAKVADFGFSRTGPIGMDVTHVSTKVKGTAGYLDPEYIKNFHISPKSDVYSYGVLLIEIISGRRPIEASRPSKERVTIIWACDNVKEGNVSQILDPKLEATAEANIVVDRIVELAFYCLAPRKEDRPTMQEVGAVLWNIRKGYQNSLQVSSSRRSSYNGM